VLRMVVLISIDIAEAKLNYSIQMGRLLLSIPTCHYYGQFQYTLTYLLCPRH